MDHAALVKQLGLRRQQIGRWKKELEGKIRNAYHDCLQSWDETPALVNSLLDKKQARSLGPVRDAFEDCNISVDESLCLVQDFKDIRDRINDR